MNRRTREAAAAQIQAAHELTCLAAMLEQHALELEQNARDGKVDYCTSEGAADLVRRALELVASTQYTAHQSEAQTRQTIRDDVAEMVAAGRAAGTLGLVG